MIKETIVVEGKNDAAAVRRAVDAHIIITSGFGLTKATLIQIRTAQERNGVIILTDPDYMGEKIRRIVADKVSGVRHAFVPREEAQADGDVGVENASPDSIRRALTLAETELKEIRQMFSHVDMNLLGLSGQAGSADLRAKIGALLGIGYGNAKQFLNRLNQYGITKEEFEEAYKNIFAR